MYSLVLVYLCGPCSEYSQIKNVILVGELFFIERERERERIGEWEEERERERRERENESWHEFQISRMRVWKLEGGKEKGLNNNGKKRINWFCESGT